MNPPWRPAARRQALRPPPVRLKYQEPQFNIILMLVGALHAGDDADMMDSPRSGSFRYTSAAICSRRVMDFTLVCHVMGCDARLGRPLGQKLCCTFVLLYQDGDFETAAMTQERGVAAVNHRET